MVLPILFSPKSWTLSPMIPSLVGDPVDPPFSLQTMYTSQWVPTTLDSSRSTVICP